MLKALISNGLKIRAAIMTGGQAEEDRRSKALKTQEQALKVRPYPVGVATWVMSWGLTDV